MTDALKTLGLKRSNWQQCQKNIKKFSLVIATAVALISGNIATGSFQDARYLESSKEEYNQSRINILLGNIERNTKLNVAKMDELAENAIEQNKYFAVGINRNFAIAHKKHLINFFNIYQCVGNLPKGRFGLMVNGNITAPAVCNPTDIDSLLAKIQAAKIELEKTGATQEALDSLLAIQSSYEHVMNNILLEAANVASKISVRTFEKGDYSSFAEAFFAQRRWIESYSNGYTFFNDVAMPRYSLSVTASDEALIREEIKNVNNVDYSYIFYGISAASFFVALFVLSFITKNVKAMRKEEAKLAKAKLVENKTIISDKKVMVSTINKNFADTEAMDHTDPQGRTISDLNTEINNLRNSADAAQIALPGFKQQQNAAQAAVDVARNADLEYKKTESYRGRLVELKRLLGVITTNQENVTFLEVKLSDLVAKRQEAKRVNLKADTRETGNTVTEVATQEVNVENELELARVEVTKAKKAHQVFGAAFYKEYNQATRDAFDEAIASYDANALAKAEAKLEEVNLTISELKKDLMYLEQEEELQNSIQEIDNAREEFNTPAAIAARLAQRQLNIANVERSLNELEETQAQLETLVKPQSALTDIKSAFIFIYRKLQELMTKNEKNTLKEAKDQEKNLGAEA